MPSENAVVEDGKTEEEMSALDAKLDSFGKPLPEVFDAYRYVVYLRSKYTTEYMTNRFQKKKEVEQGRSCISKCGSLLKTLIVYGIVAAVMIPSIYEIYTKLTNDGKSALVEDHEIITTSKKDLTPEEIAERAA